jgi:molybdenum cofactor cytidylyltransferase
MTSQARIAVDSGLRRNDEISYALLDESLRELASALIIGILLAAGRSTRFGGDKLMQRLPNGVPIVEASARALSACVDRTVAVVRRERTPLTAHLAALDIDLIVCPQAEAGMGVSLACGIAASRDAAGWIVYLADMPFIQPATVAAVAERLRQGAPIAAPCHGGRRGHPVGFGGRFGDELLACSGDTGARRILAANAELVENVPVADEGIFQDIDRQCDLPS